MLEIGLRDGMFPHAHSMSTGGETLGEYPKRFRWNRTDKLPITFYTDHCIPQVADDDWSLRKVALLIEAPKFRPLHYALVQQYEQHFDYILTYHRDLLETKDQNKWMWYPRCCSYVPEDGWGFKPKKKLVSFLASDKRGAEGHNFRHEVWNALNGAFDAYGPIAGDAPVSKRIALENYYYSVIIPGERGRGLFCDHIVDCMAFGTIPIYWKKYDIDRYFNMDGIIPFEDVNQLRAVLQEIDRAGYLMRRAAVLENIETAKQYRIAEDWLWRYRPYLFEE